jgi:hypothetical protein
MAGMHMVVERFEIIVLVKWRLAAQSEVSRAWHTRLSRPCSDDDTFINQLTMP